MENGRRKSVDKTDRAKAKRDMSPRTHPLLRKGWGTRKIKGKGARLKAAATKATAGAALKTAALHLNLGQTDVVNGSHIAKEVRRARHAVPLRRNSGNER